MRHFTTPLHSVIAFIPSAFTGVKTLSITQKITSLNISECNIVILSVANKSTMLRPVCWTKGSCSARALGVTKFISMRFWSHFVVLLKSDLDVQRTGLCVLASFHFIESIVVGRRNGKSTKWRGAVMVGLRWNVGLIRKRVWVKRLNPIVQFWSSSSLSPAVKLEVAGWAPRHSTEWHSA